MSRPSLTHLRLLRPATVDLVVTKMMRGDDPADMSDAKFMIEQEQITKRQLEDAFSEMKPIELVELRDAFKTAKPMVLGFAK